MALRGLSRTSALLLRSGATGIGPNCAALLSSNGGTSALTAAAAASHWSSGASQLRGVSSSTLDPTLAARTGGSNYGIRCALLMCMAQNEWLALPQGCSAQAAHVVQRTCHGMQCVLSPLTLYCNLFAGLCQSGQHLSLSALANTPRRCSRACTCSSPWSA
jgi:hypothetical protein